MNPDNPSNRKLLNVTLLVILSPLYALVLFTPHTGILRNLAECWHHGTPFAAPLLYVFLLGCVVSIIWLLWRAAFVGSIFVLLVTMVVHGVVSSHSSTSKTYELAIGAGRPVLGIDVYCNDIHLGKTPLTITEAEFKRTVKPWDTPPDQPLLILQGDDDNNRYAWAKFFYVPHDIFEMSRQWPPDHFRYNRHNDKETLEDLKKSKYWWRFEKDGCIGLSQLANFSGGSGGSTVVTINVNPSIRFLSAAAHLDALLAQLEQERYEPTQVWLDHFLKYKDLLFLEFYAKTKDDERLQAALDAVVRFEFNIPMAPSESDCQRVVDEIAKRADTFHCFTVPSIESLAMEMAAQAHAQPIVDRFLETASLSRAGSSGRRGGGVWTTHRRSGPRAQLLPIEHAIRKTAPALLFDRLVYMSRGGGYMDLLGNYPREELLGLFSHYLRNIKRQGGRGRDSRINETIRVCAQVKNPILEETLRQFVRENAGQGRGSTKHHIHQFIESRINDPAIDQEQLATWIFRLAPLDDRAKIRFLLKIQVPNVCHFLNILVVQNERDRADVIHQLGVHPNPALDKFVIDTYNWYRSPQAHGCWLLDLTDALVRIDTLAVRKLITGEWDEAGNTRLSLLSHLISGSSVVRWRQPNMNWLVPMIAELYSKRELNLAVNLLARIDTPEAYELAEKWTTDPDSDIAEAAAEQLKIRDQRAAQRQQQLAQAADLLAGNIKPDDLLPTPTAYTWNGTEYLPGDASE